MAKVLVKGDLLVCPEADRCWLAEKCLHAKPHKRRDTCEGFCLFDHRPGLVVCRPYGVEP